MFHKLKKISEENEALYISLLQKQHDYIQKLHARKELSPYRKIIIHPSEVFNKDDTIQNSKLKSRFIRNISTQKHREHIRTVSPHPKTSSRGELNSRPSHRHPNIHKKSLLSLITNSSTPEPNPMQCIKTIEKYRLDSSYLRASTPPRSHESCSLSSPPKRIKIIRSRFGLGGDSSWLYESKTDEDQLRECREQLVQDVMKKAVRDFELEADQYIENYRLIK
jgi:hypothetical protein